mgnify:CR=1 FL=1
MDFKEFLEQKEWVCEDETIEYAYTRHIGEGETGEAVDDRFGNPLMLWRAPVSYIPEVTFNQAQEDPDVCVGDIHLEKGYIFLMDNRNGDWEQ